MISSRCNVVACTPDEIKPYTSSMMPSPNQLTDAALLAEVKRLAQYERETVATLVAHLVVVEVRDLYRSEGCSSMFKYCTEVLRFSEDAAMVRLQATRAAREHAFVIEDLASGALSLSSLRVLAPHLTSENALELIAASRHKSKREVEKILRERFPLPDVTTLVRRLPATVSLEAGAPRQASAPQESGVMLAGLSSNMQRGQDLALRPSVIAPLAPERYKVQFTASANLHVALRRAQDLLRHRIPSGDMSQVFELALDALVEKLEKQRCAATDRPRAGRAADASRVVPAGSRVIPAAVKRAVYKRDGGQCAFVAKNGRRCSETGFLEFHHVVPFARGGQASVANIALRCRSHNQYEAKLDFGPFDPSIVREAGVPWGATAREPSAPKVGTGGEASQVVCT